MWTSNPHVFALQREHAGERMLLLANLTALEQAVRGFRVAQQAASTDGRPFETRGDYVVLRPYQFLWLT